eukprot:TRINITY_DN4432_c0_g1_i1.p1 TRINITY_DN4432_c0_g1~~TRINITY_DN4432_c0_g1_i1.p1  ORF type:complete len:121 (+),score=16.98 TRINITY_DN4432_c0_g1_i1:130-492(+)
MGRPGETPRDQWRSRSKKSAAIRRQKLRTGNLAKNLEKVENLQYQKDRLERDRARLEQGEKPAGHHNLPAEILKPAKDVSKAPLRSKAPTPLFPPNTLIGLIKPEVVRKRLQSMFEVENA